MATKVNTSRCKQAEPPVNGDGADTYSSEKCTDEGLVWFITDLESPMRDFRAMPKFGAAGVVRYILEVEEAVRQARKNMLWRLRRDERFGCSAAGSEIEGILADGEWHLRTELESAVMACVMPSLLHRPSLLIQLLHGADPNDYEQTDDDDGARIWIDKVVGRLLIKRQVELDCQSQNWTRIRWRPRNKAALQTGNNTTEKQRRPDPAHPKSRGAGK